MNKNVESVFFSFEKDNLVLAATMVPHPRKALIPILFALFMFIDGSYCLALSLLPLLLSFYSQIGLYMQSKLLVWAALNSYHTHNSFLVPM